MKERSSRTSYHKLWQVKYDFDIFDESWSSFLLPLPGFCQLWWFQTQIRLWIAAARIQCFSDFHSFSLMFSGISVVFGIFSLPNLQPENPSWYFVCYGTGVECGTLSENKTCDNGECPVDCELSDWGTGLRWDSLRFASNFFPKQIGFTLMIFDLISIYFNSSPDNIWYIYIYIYAMI